MFYLSLILLNLYLYKYIHKGPDRANLVVANPDDEITLHLDARYVAAPEATWRIFRFPLHDKSHSVERLPVHLPRGQNVLFEVGREAEALHQALTKQTKLEAYFALNLERSQVGNEKSATQCQQITNNVKNHQTYDSQLLPNR